MILLNIFTFQSGDFYNQGSSFSWETIIAALIAALVVMIGYRIQKKNEQEAKNREDSKQAYLKFLDDFTQGSVIATLEDEYLNSFPPADSNEQINKHKIESQKRKLLARNHLLMYGSDNVIKAYLNFIKHIDEVVENEIEDKQEGYFNKILVEIRNEIYKDSKITDSEISNYFNEFNRRQKQHTANNV